ncbi:MAG: hypothetical protein U0228_08815 [Myxococcaceae bacterium]
MFLKHPRPLHRLVEWAFHFCVLALVVSAGCTKPPAPPPTTSVVSEARRLLAERDRKLQTYRLEVTSTEGERVARHTFAFRSPNKSRGHVLAPQEVELAFDGQKLVRVLYGPSPDGGAPAKVNEPIPLDMGPTERVFFLASTFMPFAPEGFRSPLIPMAGVEGRQLVRPGPGGGVPVEAYEVTVKPGQGVVVSYVLRASNGDFLEKRSNADGRTRVLSVKREQCDEKLGLCVPLELVETVVGDAGVEPLGTTVVTKAELNPELPQDFFTP